MQEGTFKPLSEYKGLPKPAKSDELLYFSDHVWTEDDYLIGCTKQGDLFAIETFDVFQTMPFDSKASYCRLIAFSLGFCAATDDGMLHFYKFSPEKKKFEFVRKWSCIDIKNYKIVSMSIHEVSKEELYLAIATKNNNILYLNLIK